MTLVVPWVVTKLAGTVAVNWPLLTNVVARLVEPFQTTTALLAKFAPLTVMVN